MSDSPQGNDPSPPPVPTPSSAGDPLADAKRRLDDMDWHGAVEAANAVLAAQPENAEARTLRDAARHRVDELEAQLQRKKRAASAKRDIARLI